MPEKLKRSSIWLVFLIALAVVFSIMIKYQFVGETNMPFKPSDFVSTLLMLLPDYVYRSRRKKRSVEDQSVIDEAKMILMNRNEMTEPEAFRYIQKTSMDTGRSMVESAQMILMLNRE